MTGPHPSRAEGYAISVAVPPSKSPGLVAFTAGFGAIITAMGVGATALAVAFMGWEALWVAWLPVLPVVAIGGGLIALAARFRVMSREPLLVEPSGRVVYRGRTLFPSVARVIVRRSVGQDEGGPVDVFHVFAETEGRVVELPSPYFTTFTARTEAEAIAGRVAEALQVEIVWPD